MDFAITLVDINPRLVAAWQEAFADAVEVQVVFGSILQRAADAWVTPTNARGSMDGGLDAVMKRYFGAGVEARVRREVAARFGGRMPVGCATCISTVGLTVPRGGPRPDFLVSAATMGASSEDVSGTHNAAWALAAAVQAARSLNALQPGSAIRSLVVPGLGASTGRVPPRECARQMRRAYDLMSRQSFDGFEALREGLLLDAEDAITRVPPHRRRRFLGIPV